MFNLKEFIINNLINGVKNKTFSKEYASILATNYLIKGILSEEDIIKFDTETTVGQEVVEHPIEDTEETENIETTEEVENTSTETVVESEV